MVYRDLVAVHLEVSSVGEAQRSTEDAPKSQYLLPLGLAVVVEK